LLEFERIKRRNQDYLLIETIKQVGASNYSLVARLTGLNPETVRYKVSKQLVKFGLSLSLNINYGELGFSLGLLSVTPAPANGSLWTRQAPYLLICSKVMSANKAICLYGIPPRFKKKYNEQLESLKQKKLIDDFSSTELHWVRYPPFRSEMYDFDKKCWVVDWGRVDATMQESGATVFANSGEPKVDDIDLKILKYLKQNPTVGLARIGKEIGVNPRTVRYHHTNHVLNGKLLLGNNIRWTRPGEGEEGKVMQILASFKGLGTDELTTVRKLFNSLPFTWLEAGTDTRDYFAFLDIPILDFHETMGYVEGRVQAARSKLEVSILDPALTEDRGIPEEMFDKRMGWRLFELPAATEGGKGQP
jgi:hypothetical protein